MGNKDRAGFSAESKLRGCVCRCDIALDLSTTTHGHQDKNQSPWAGVQQGQSQTPVCYGLGDAVKYWVAICTPEV